MRSRVGLGVAGSVLCLSMVSLSASAEQRALPQPPVMVHHRSPDTRAVETVYSCAGSTRRFSIRYEGTKARARFVSGSRLERELDPADVERGTEALRRLDAVRAVYPECGAASDVLTAYGLVNNKEAMVLIPWTAHGLQAPNLKMLER